MSDEPAICDYCGEYEHDCECEVKRLRNQLAAAQGEIERLRKSRSNVLKAWKPFAERRGLPFESPGGTAEQAHFMAMGAIAMANSIVRPDYPDNLGKLIRAMLDDNAKAALAAPAEVEKTDDA